MTKRKAVLMALLIAALLFCGVFIFRRYAQFEPQADFYRTYMDTSYTLRLVLLTVVLLLFVVRWLRK